MCQWRRDSSIWAAPRAPDETQTLSAANTLAAAPNRLSPSPTTGCDEPYIGDESISRPPNSKNAFITSAQASRATRSLPTLNVIQVPRPTLGSASPLDGIALTPTPPTGRPCVRTPVDHGAAQPTTRPCRISRRVERISTSCGTEKLDRHAAKGDAF